MIKKEWIWKREDHPSSVESQILTKTNLKSSQSKGKTPMQEMLQWVRATLPMDLDTSILIEEKVISMLEKEKEYYNETFNTKEK